MTDNEILKNIIDYYKLSTSKFAKFINVNSVQRLYDILNGRNGISKEIREKIKAKCVDINPIWLYTGEGEMLLNLHSDTSSHNNTSNCVDLNKIFEIIERKDKQLDRIIEVIEQKDEKINSLIEAMGQHENSIKEVITLLQESKKAHSSDGENENKEVI